MDDKTREDIERELKHPIIRELVQKLEDFRRNEYHRLSQRPDAEECRFLLSLCNGNLLRTIQDLGGL